jgi:hypothetical protein
MDKKAKIGIAILGVIAAIAAGFLWYFLPIEGCLDLGGKWDYDNSVCIRQ